ncbi:MAG: hypothetical protein PF961_06645 [Planctomycetota bacterium]|jgi:hypothetical protein|nr:hypothetical protein [Planctomycetota bacterium]
MRIAPLLALCCALPAWALEPTDVRLSFELWSPDYEVDFSDAFGPNFSTDSSFESSWATRLGMYQPLNILQTGDLVSVISLGFMDAQDEDWQGVELSYQGVSARYGFGYRAELGDAFAIDMYPYLGIGWTSFEVSSTSDPALLWEYGVQAEVAATVGSWQIGGQVGFNSRQSGHEKDGFEWDISYQAVTYGGFLGYRF